MPDARECQPIEKQGKKRKAPYASTKQNKAEATRLHSLIVRSRGVCELANKFNGTPCEGPLQCAHIIPRRYSRTRTLEANALSLCAHHHRVFDAFPGRQGVIVDALNFEGFYDRLARMAAEGIAGTGKTPLVFWREERARLAAIWKQLEETR